MTGVRAPLTGHALITGGSAGIGLHIAKNLAREGCDITIIDINETKAAVSDIEAVTGVGKVQGLQGDVSNYKQILESIKLAEKEFGPVSILVANAGILLPTTRIVDQEPEVFEKVAKVNYLGVVNTVKAALPGMLERNDGRIVIMGSLSGVLGAYGISSYAATKAAVRSFSDILRLEVLGTGVSVHLAQPSFTNTPMGERCLGCMDPWLTKFVQKMGSHTLHPVEEVASMIVNGIRKKSNYMLITPGGMQLYNILQSTAGFLAPSAFSLLFEMFIAPLQALVKRLFRMEMERTILAARRDNSLNPFPAVKKVA
eukprot:jgi/Botrbrau1/18035/Bobra.0062s0025.1